MKATVALLTEVGKDFELVDVEIDDPRDDEVIVKMEAAGVCHTDLAIRDGHMPVPFPMVLGHEGAGTVERVGARVSKVVPGDRVAFTPAHCGTCLNCLTGHRQTCISFFPRNMSGARVDGSHGYHKDGSPIGAFFLGQSSFGTHALVDQQSVVKLPDSAAPELAGPLSCGAQTGAGAVLNALKPRVGSSIVIFGAGPVGLGALLAARALSLGAVVVVEPKPVRREVATSLGATTVIDPAAGDAAEVVRAMTGGVGADYAVDTTGIPAVIQNAVELLMPAGEVALLGTPQPGARLDLDLLDATARGIRVRGVTMGDGIAEVFLPELLSLHRQGRFPIERIITPYPFEQINEAARASTQGEVIKAVLTF